MSECENIDLILISSPFFNYWQFYYSGFVLFIKWFYIIPYQNRLPIFLPELITIHVSNNFVAKMRFTFSLTAHINWHSKMEFSVHKYLGIKGCNRISRNNSLFGILLRMTQNGLYKDHNIRVLALSYQNDDPCSRKPW